MLQYEIKKLYIKQFFLLVAILCIILKCVTLLGLQQQEKVDFTPQDKPMFVSLVKELGGQITEQSEEKMNSSLNELYEAEKSADQLRSRILAGEYDDTTAYSEEYAKLLDVLQQKTALAALNEEYLYASLNPENRWILSSSLPVMETNSVDFVLLIFVLLLPIMVYYQEDKTKVALIIKSNNSGSKRTAYTKMLLIVFSVTTACLLFFSLDYLYCLMTLQKGEMMAPLQSLRFFSDSRYNITIAEAFWGISAIKLLGYLFLALLCGAIVVKAKKQIPPILLLLGIYVIEPFALSNKNIIYFTPFSLIKATGFFRGNEQIIVNKGLTTQTTVQDFTMITSAQMLTIIVVSLAVICISALICYKAYCTRRKHFKMSMLLCISLCLLSGCSLQNNPQDNNTVNLNNSDVLTQNDTAYFFQEKSSIQMVDKATGTQENILRTPFLSEEANIKAISCTNEYLYYLISTNLSNDIYQINLEDFGQEVVFSQQLSSVDSFLGLSQKSISFGIRDIKKMFIYGDDLYFLTNNTDGLYCYSILGKSIEKIISDDVFNNNLSVISKKIYYINSMLELKCYDMQSGKEEVISDIPCRSLYVYDEDVFVSGSKGIFSVDTGPGMTKKLSDIPSNNIAFDGENLFYTDPKGSLILVNPEGKEQVLCENVRQFEVANGVRSVVYTYIIDNTMKREVMRY